MKRMLFSVLLILPLALLQALTPETRTAAKAASSRGFAWLRAAQSQDGSWSDRRFPGLSALVLWSMAAAKDTANTDSAKRAAAYIVSCAQPDGGIYVPVPGRLGSGLGNYNTCLCLTALHAHGDAAYNNVMLGARSYIASTQIETEGMHEGGFGYDRSSPRTYTDMNNTFYAIDAMTRTQALEETRPASEKRVSVDWDAARKYVLSMQQTEGDEKGGFFYTKTPPRKKPGQTETPRLRTTGSMSYAGLLSMLHCKLTERDPRVRSTVAFLGNHWTLKENPGQGSQGLFFYYDVMTRALTAAGIDKLTLADGTALDWREALAKELISRQQADGSWKNANNRFWEGDPALSTGYALLALSLLLQ